MLNFLEPAAEWGVVSILKILKIARVHVGRRAPGGGWFVLG